MRKFYLSIILVLGLAGAASATTHTYPPVIYADLVNSTSVDQTSALQAIYDNAPANSIIQLPPGYIKLTATINMNRASANIGIRGAGNKQTCIYRTTDYGDTFYVYSSGNVMYGVSITDLDFYSTVKMTSGAHIHVKDADKPTIRDIHMWEGFGGILLEGVLGFNIGDLWIYLGGLNTSSENTYGIKVTNTTGRNSGGFVSNVWINRSGAAGTGVSYGFWVGGCDGLWVSNIHAMASHKANYYICPDGSGTHTTSVLVSNGYADECSSSGGDGIKVITGSSQTAFGNISFVNSIVGGNADSDSNIGVYVNASDCDDFRLIGSKVFGWQSHGVDIEAVKSFTISGNSIVNNNCGNSSANGINIANSVSNGCIIGNTIGHPDAFSPTEYSHANGLYIGTGCTDLQVALNSYGSDNTSDTSINSTITNDGLTSGAAVTSGSTVPGSPTTGQLFLHTPTGRIVLMEYANSAWNPIRSYGTMTVYVDNTDGTDSVDKGGSADSGAYKTIAYAISQIPPTIGGNVTVNINAETYAENVVISGKNVGSYTITLQGTLSTDTAATAQDSSVQGATSTYGSITKTGAFTSKAGKILYSSNNLEYRIITSVSDNTGTIVGYWASTPSGNFAIYDWGTSVQRILVDRGQQNIVLNDLHLSGSSYSSLVYYDATMTLNRCKLDLINYAYTGSHVFYNDCFIDNGNVVVASGPCAITASRCKFTYANATYQCLLAQNNSYVTLSGVCVFDGVSPNSQFGVIATKGCTVDMSSLYHTLSNLTDGMTADKGAQVLGTANNIYSGNTRNETATSASFGYID